MTLEEQPAPDKGLAAADACYKEFKAALQPLVRTHDIRLVVMALTEITSQVASAGMRAGYLEARAVAQWFSDALADAFTRKDVSVGNVTLVGDAKGVMQ